MLGPPFIPDAGSGDGFAKSKKRAGWASVSDVCEAAVGCGPKGEGLVTDCAVEGCPNDAKGFDAGFASIEGSVVAVEGCPNAKGFVGFAVTPCVAEANGPDGFVGAAENDHDDCGTAVGGAGALELLANGEAAGAVLLPKVEVVADWIPLRAWLGTKRESSSSSIKISSTSSTSP